MQLAEIKQNLRAGTSLFATSVGFNGQVRIVEAKRELGTLKVKTANGDWIIPIAVTKGGS